nr:nucleic acid-binding, OB-fold protein [Tanacetum cinerariifolium]
MSVGIEAKQDMSSTVADTQATCIRKAFVKADGFSIRVTIWGALGDVLVEKKSKQAGMWTFVLTSANAKHYKNKLYFSSSSSAMVFNDAGIPAVKALMTNMPASVEESKKFSVPVDHSTPRKGTLKNLLMWARNRKNDTVIFHCKVRIANVRMRKGWNFPSCGGENCKKGATRRLGQFCRYRLELDVADDTANIVVVMFDEPATTLVGCSAESVMGDDDEDPSVPNPSKPSEDRPTKRMEIEDSNEEDKCGLPECGTRKKDRRHSNKKKSYGANAINTSSNPIPHGQPYRCHLNGPVHMMTARKRVRPLPVQQLLGHLARDVGPLMTSVPALPLVSGALSLVHADLIPPPKRLKDIGYLADVERVTHPAMPEDIPEPAQEGAAEVTYETLGDLAQRFHDHTQAIPVHRIQTTKGIHREQGCRIVRVESAVIALTERVAELERDNRGLKALRVLRVREKMPNIQSRASMTHKEVEELIARRVAEEMEAREVARNLEALNENEKEQEGENGGNENGGNGGNGNGANRRNGNGGNRNEGNGNHGMNYEGFMPMARECTFQDFLKCKPHTFSGTEGVVGLTRWFEKMETVFNISNCASKYQMKYATCTLENNDLTWWNSHKRTIGVDTAYSMKWAGLMKLMIEVYCPRNEVQKMEAK